MKRLIHPMWLIVASLAALTACTSASGPTFNAYTLTGADGAPTYQVTCHGLLEGRSVCEQQAQQICGDQAVRVVEAIAGLGQTRGGEADARILTFQCGAAPAPAPIAAAAVLVEPQQTPAPQAAPLTATVHFATNQATLSDEARSRLDALLEQVRSAPVSGARIDGYTDSTGPLRINQPLSTARAQAAARYLRERGVRTLQVRGHGPHDPVADNRTRSGRAQNRRADVELRP
ncbi:OmpA family protein [Burkholderia singularis]|nr:OmpA family protein [Burkholderia singularis]